MFKILLLSINRNIMKMFEFIFIVSMFQAIENRNAFYAIGGYVLYCMADACVEERKKLEHRPNKENIKIGMVTLADDFDRSRIHIEEYR